MSKMVLGLDIGTNSIGWALVREDDTGNSIGLVDCGVRIFQAALDPKSEVPRNQARRAARAARRVLARRRLRMRRLVSLLSRAGFWQPPSDRPIQAHLNQVGDPYALRARGLDHALSPNEFGRVLVHLCQRRGFRSNRKADRKPKEKQGGDEQKVREGMLDKIAGLGEAIRESGARTLGEYLHRLQHPDPSTAPQQPPHKRRRHTDRSMYEHEFAELWKIQEQHHVALRDRVLRLSVHRALFHQRPLKSPLQVQRARAQNKPKGEVPRSRRNNLGKCTFFPDRRRLGRGTLLFQRARLLQTVNSLEIKDPISRDFRKLVQEERRLLIDALSLQKEMTWGPVRKLLGLKDGETFNLESDLRTKLLGDQVNAPLHKALGEAWLALSADRRDALVEDLNTIDDPRGLLRRLEQHWGFAPELAERLASLDLPEGFGNMSGKALRAILPRLEAGALYSDACEQAGFDHSKPPEVRERELLDFPPRLRNPVVQKALWEVRRVVNAIIRRYGRPARLQVELARDARMGPKDRARYEKQQKANTRMNEEAQEKAASLGMGTLSRSDRLKYRLWKESSICPYTGHPIPYESLYSSEVDIEHIIPYHRSLDDSYMNKTLCMAEENRLHKRGFTPFEAYSGDASRYHDILQRARKLPYPKRLRFEKKTVEEEGFVARQLNDTRYIALEVRDYLRQISPAGEAVRVGRGDITSEARYLLGLNHLLDRSGSGRKHRDDHRHHALDAIVVAMTTPRMFQAMRHRYSNPNFQLVRPWPSFETDVAKAMQRIIVSHATDRRVSGAFHEATAYGVLEDGSAAYRVRLDANFKPERVEAIRDDRVRELIRAHLLRSGNDPKRAFAESNPVMHADGRTPIRSVRVRASMPATALRVFDPDRRPAGFKLGNNHHVEIFEHTESKKRAWRVVSTLEVADRVRRRRLPPIDREYGDGWRFVLALHVNDMVHWKDASSEAFYRVQKISEGDVMLRLHTAAKPDNPDERIRLTSVTRTRSIASVSIDALGQVL